MIRISIASKVLAGIISIILTAIISAVVLALTFQNFQKNFAEISNRKLPGLIGASQLVREAEQLIANAPDIIIAQNDDTLNRVAQDVEDKIRLREKLILPLTNAGISSKEIDLLSRQFDLVFENLRTLIEIRSSQLRSAESVQYGTGEQNIFDLKRYQIDMQKKTEENLIENKLLSAELVRTANRIFSEIQTDTVRQNELFNQGIRQMLMTSVYIRIFGITLVTLIYFYIRKSVIGRILILGKCMRDHIEGRPCPVPVSGADEITDMAKSVDYFISEIRKREEKLVRAKETAEAATCAKSEFLANISHELRTPLNAVIGFSDLLSSMITDERQKNYLDAIQSGGKNLLILINDILDLSKIEFGKLEIHLKPVRFHNIFKDIRNIFSLKVSEKGLKFITDIADDIPESLLMDEIRLRQILLNLVGNAMKFTEKGEIKISAKCRMQNAKCDLTITVEDTGIGISPEFFDNIFDAFQQDRRISSKYGGTGLGLTITKRLVNMMNGDISVKSMPGTGTAFEVILRDVPICETPFAAESVISDYDNIIFENAVILIADDIESNREMIKACFNGMQIRIIEAQDGQEAVCLAEQFEPDIILMDIRMNVMDGYEATRQIRSSMKLAHIPVIAISASVLSEDREKITESGLFDGFLAKPIWKAKLFCELSQFIFHTRQNVTCENKQPDSKTEYLCSELIGKLENEFTELWKEVCKNRVFGDIEKFADKIRAAGNEYSSELLINYGHKLISHARNFDIDKVKPLLYSYPELVENIRAGKEQESDG